MGRLSTRWAISRNRPPHGPVYSLELRFLRSSSDDAGRLPRGGRLSSQMTFDASR